MIRQEIETALDSGRLEVAMQRGAWWKARRNGKTRLWARNPERFYIPAKAGFRSCFAISESWLNEEGNLFRITPAEGA